MRPRRCWRSLAGAAPCLLRRRRPRLSRRSVEFLPRFDFHLTRGAPLERRSAVRVGRELRRRARPRRLRRADARPSSRTTRRSSASEFRALRSEPGQLHARGRRCRRAPRGVEAAAVFHHVSRHLSDRAKRQAGGLEHDRRPGRARRAREGAPSSRAALISGASCRSRSSTTAGSSTRHARARVRVSRDGGAVCGRRRAGARRRRHARPRDAVRLPRRRRRAARRDAAPRVELFVAGERRIDPYPLEFATATWVTAGFRLLSPVNQHAIIEPTMRLRLALSSALPGWPSLAAVALRRRCRPRSVRPSSSTRSRRCRTGCG